MLLQNPVLPFPSFSSFPSFSPFELINLGRYLYPPSIFWDLCSFRLYPPLNDPTDEPGPFSGEFQLFALHISPTFASNLKSCSRQIQNLFQKNRTPCIFQLCARARGLNSQFSMVRLTIFKRKSKMSQKDTNECNMIILHYNY